MKFRPISSLILLASLSHLTYAEDADRSKPIEITADQGSLDQQNQVTTWKGNVVIIQGTLKFTSADLQVTRNTEGFQKMVATGKPVTFRQKLEGKPQYVSGHANKVEYDSKTNVVILTGAAQVKREGDVVDGARITYNTATETYQVDGSAGKQVKVILQPSTTEKKK
ncbi:lipopolysaccharide transport periplasmic protein LptA [Neisseria sp. Ec49-e6-T10]|uniref:lipopolysaccharide transport periplasmic protein LptA n=1 Tax=Neisseria sp. Ec49-e6-T10 TaxID=3140744 RepID=UPI003EBE3A3B